MKLPPLLLSVQGRLSIYEAVRTPMGFVKGNCLVGGKNVITTLGRERIAKLLVGESTEYVDHLAIGDGGAPQDDLLNPIVATKDDTELEHELDSTTSVNPIVTGQILTFEATFLTASLGGPDFIDEDNKVVNEAGLFTPDEVLFARKTFPSIPFSPLDRVGVIMLWEIEVL